MKNTVTLKKNYEFARVFKRGSFYVGRHIIVYVLPNKLSSGNRIGISVSKKAGKAVVRNRKKRLIRECYSYFEDFIFKGNDFVIAAKADETVPGYGALLKEFKYLLKKLQVFDQEKYNCLKVL